MIGPIKTVGIYVQDQQNALEFYTQKLGFELRRNLSTGAKASWIDVAPQRPDVPGALPQRDGAKLGNS
jgi:lactoylglutathione lyase